MSEPISRRQVRHLEVLTFGPPPEPTTVEADRELAQLVHEAKSAATTAVQAGTAAFGRILGIEAVIDRRGKQKS